MELEIRPAVDDAERAVIAAALEQKLARSEAAWARAGLAEATDADGENEGWTAPYARSPRSTRGATRA